MPAPAWAITALTAWAHRAAGGSWAVLLARPAAFGLLLWMLRPIAPPSEAVDVQGSDADG
jgi:hypothetical protein